ncbi:unnamed protein product [Dibothriocephalus latus]|uniref:Uncharacterized protein n=1 Tax=Dibothriocephalus latus TaxID=60516 RepID=A0A3P7MAQ4_DIBLA|nr:unnamed protein product [Dibothriocephalus latus]
MPSNGESDPAESKKKIACASIFGCQKGIIFSIDTLRRSVQNQEDNQGLLVATAAEDRSVVIWENKKVAACELSPDNYKAWCPLWMLAATDPANDQVLFAARVWCVRLCNWGLVTSGEDCAISLFSWPRERLKAFAKPLVLRDIHRGRNIWSLAVLFKSETDELLLASGGGDGAVALTNLRVSCLDSADINTESETEGQITKLISVGRIKGLPSSASANPRPETIIAEPEPSFEQQSFVGQDPTTRSISKPLQFLNKPRTVFIGSKGRIYCILESGLDSIMDCDHPDYTTLLIATCIGMDCSILVDLDAREDETEWCLSIVLLLNHLSLHA